MTRFVSWPRLWPGLIVLSELLVGLVVFVFPAVQVRPFIVFGFLFLCPGATLMRFSRIQDPVTLLTLAVAISLSLDTLIAGCQLYTGHWSPEMTLAILMALTLACLLIQLLKARKGRYW